MEQNTPTPDFEALLDRRVRSQHFFGNPGAGLPDNRLRWRLRPQSVATSEKAGFDG